MMNENFADKIGRIRDVLLDLIQVEQLEFHCREDFKELLNLTGIFLGGEAERVKSIRKSQVDG